MCRGSQICPRRDPPWWKRVKRLCQLSPQVSDDINDGFFQSRYSHGNLSFHLNPDDLAAVSIFLVKKILMFDMYFTGYVEVRSCATHTEKRDATDPDTVLLWC